MNKRYMVIEYNVTDEKIAHTEVFDTLEESRVYIEKSILSLYDSFIKHNHDEEVYEYFINKKNDYYRFSKYDDSYVVRWHIKDLNEEEESCEKNNN